MQQIEITRKMGMANMAATINTSSFNVDTNEVEVVFATETLVEEEMPDGERFYEQVEISSAAADLTRLNANGPVLDSHDDTSVKKQMGVVVRAWVDDATKQAKAIVRLSRSKEWETVVNDVKDGIIRNISFKFRRMRMIDTGEVKDNKRILKTVKWEASEISFVTIPADIYAGVRKAGVEYEVTIIENKKDHTMTPEQKNALATEVKEVVRKLGLDETFAEELIAVDGMTVEVARAKAIDKVQELKDAAGKNNPVNVEELQGKERQRALDIYAVCRKLNLSEVKNDKGVLFADELVSKGITVDAARALAIDKAAEIDLTMNKPASGAGIGAGNDAREAKRAQAKEHAILERAGVELLDENGKKVKYDADVYRGMTLKELAFECLIERGMNPRNLSQRELKQWILNPEYGVRSAAGMTTSDFPSITENVLNKVALQRYQLAERTWEPLVKKRTVRDFKPISNVRLNDVVVDETSQILEGGEYTMVKMTDSKESYAVRKYGKKAVLSWEALINDDLSMFNDTVAIVIDGFTQFQNKLFYDILNATAATKNGSNKMADGVLLFHASHNNLVASGTAISVDSLGAARKLLRQQTAPNGSLLNLNPKFLVVGPEYEQLAEQYTSSNYVATEQGKINKLGASLTPIVDANITGNKWFLFATPQSIPTIEVAHLEGQEMYTESRYSFDVDGMEVKFRMTHGIKAIDFRGIVKNPGA